MTQPLVTGTLSCGTLAEFTLLRMVAGERRRQEELHGPIDTSMPDGTGPYHLLAGGVRRDAALALARATYETQREKGKLTYAHILAEEFYEVLCEEDPDKLRVELIQVAAASLKWAEAIELRKRQAVTP